LFLINRILTRDELYKALSFSLAAVLILASIRYLFYSDPLLYTRLIIEDQWGEYATAVAFVACSWFALIAALQSENRYQRLVWFCIALGAFFVGLEEISWGQRIFGISTPNIVREYNAQGELNLHNLVLIKPELLHILASLLVVSWLLASLLVWIVPQRLQDRIINLGFPAIPLSLFPLFVLPVFFWTDRVVIRWDEIGELLLGFAMAVFALDRYMRIRMPGPEGWGRTVTMICLMTLIIFTISVTPPLLVDASHQSWGLNHTAAHSYPSRKMYDQSQEIFDFIYANPIHIQPDTRIRNSRLLLQSGKPLAAKDVLEQAVKDLETLESKDAEKWLFLGIAHALLDEELEMNIALDMSLKEFRNELDRSPRNEENVETLWWQARVSVIRTDIESALKYSRAARANAVSVKLKFELDRWIECAKSESYYRPWYKYYWIEFLSIDL
jgi:hypothetical protein